VTSQTEANQKTILVRNLGRREYLGVWDLMKNFTDSRDKTTPDELWFVEHDPVFTQGLAGKAEHILAPGDIPVIQVDRGGQVTYHGPGQQVVYIMINLRRQSLGVRELVTAIENGIIGLLDKYDIKSAARVDAPGVYMLGGEKICSIGLRIRKGCSFHGLALNVDPDIEPFGRINPCGYSGLEITSMKLQNGQSDLEVIKDELANSLAHSLGYENWSEVTTPLPF
jgi:lipoyl(octanoyl) transferase